MPVVASTKRVAATADVPGIVLLVEPPARAAELHAMLASATCRVLATFPAPEDNVEAVNAHEPDIVVVAAASPTPALIENIRAVHQDRPCAIVLFADDRGSYPIEDALRAGVTSYVVGGPVHRQIGPILDIAIARFNETQTLHAELRRAKAALDERKIVERAKGVLMKERRIGEEEAYRELRRLAMDRNRRIVDIAEAILTYAQVSRSPWPDVPCK